MRRRTKVMMAGMFLVMMGWITGCQSGRDKNKSPLDTVDSGSINVSADESFKPVIDEQVKVYESNHPATRIRVRYKPEAECIKDLGVDSIRMVIITRTYTDAEKNVMMDSLKVGPEWMTIARDAIAVIVNPAAPDSLFTMGELRGILTGRSHKNLTPVFDGVQATSTVRFIVDSVLRTDSLTPRAMAARSSEGVIDYVATHPEAVGFIGVSWIGDKDDSQEVSFLRKVKIAQLESTNIPGNYVLPVQANIYLKRYPMVRDLVYILKENYHGLGYGFAGFLSGEIGQLIFKRAYLMPMLRNFRIRPIRVTE